MEHCERPKRSGNTQTRVSHHEAFQHPPRLPPHTHIHNLALHDRKTGFCVQASASSPRKRVQLLRKSAFVCVCVLVKKTTKKKTACGHTGLSEECFEKSGGKFSCHQARHCPKSFKVYSCGRRTKKTHNPLSCVYPPVLAGEKKNC